MLENFDFTAISQSLLGIWVIQCLAAIGYSGRIFRLTDKNLALWLTVVAVSVSILLEKHFHITVVEPPGVKGLSYSLIDVSVCNYFKMCKSVLSYLLTCGRFGHTARRSAAVWTTWSTLTGWERLTTMSCKFSSLALRSTLTSTIFDRTPTTPVSQCP